MTHATPFHVSLSSDDVLRLTLDTPSSDVNVFTRPAALQLRSILSEVDPRTVRAVVLDSAKPTSFVNGVGLMLASAVRAPEDAGRLTAGVRDAYRALRELRVPTFAAIHGNCFGCGVELAMQCEYRIAADDFDTQFYMTEIADYLFVPAFGATQDLPRLVGLRAAVDLLLWGVRWTGRDAARAGLVDACLPQVDFAAGVESFVAETLAGRRVPRARSAAVWGPDEEALAEETRRAIDALPTQVRSVYLACWWLLSDTARGVRRRDEGQRRELLACGRSVMSSESKNAQSFFFVRQMADQVCRRGFDAPTRWHVELRGLGDLEDDLRERRANGVAFDDEREDGSRFLLGPPGANDAELDAAILLDPWHDALVTHAPVLGYAPLYASGITFVELCAYGADNRARGLYDVLSRTGFGAVLSRPRGKPLIDGMLDAYFAPLFAHVGGGGNADDAARALHEVGFVRGPGDLAAMLPERFSLGAFLGASWRRGELRPALVDALVVSLAEFAFRALRDRELAHPTLVDRLARDVIDFPLAHGSLCRWLTRGRVRAALASASGIERLVSHGAIALATAYATQDRSFYA